MTTRGGGMATIGLFGKIPSVGDFVSRNLSPMMCDRLHHMIQAALMSVMSEGGDRRHLMSQAQPMMLSIRPGVLCESGFAGLWFPSCDRVGRVFPMCVGMEVPADMSRFPLVWPSPSLTKALCHVVAAAVQQGDGPDDLLARLPTPEDWQKLATQDVPFGDVAEETVPTVSVEDVSFCLDGPEDLMTVSNRALCSRLPWVAEMLGTVVGPTGGVAVYFGSRSILSWTNLAALFDKQWRHWGWTCFHLTGDKSGELQIVVEQSVENLDKS